MRYGFVIAGVAGIVVAFGAGFLLGGRGAAPAKPSPAPAAAKVAFWTCPMDPQVKQPDPGKCPLCGMDLVPVAPGAKDPGTRRLRLSEEGRALAEIRTAPVVRDFPVAEVRMVGLVDYDETRVRTIAARIPGRLDRLYVDFTGTRVRSGDHLVSLYSPELLTAQEELLEWKRQVADTAREGSDFLRESTRRSLESARDKLRLWGLGDAQIAAIETRGTAEDHVMIPSPTTGVVIHKAVNEGDYVKVGTPIYKIAEIGKLWVQLDAYESDLPWIRYGQEVAIETEACPGEVFRGWISFVAPELDRRTRTVKVRVNVDNSHERLRPGMFARAVVRVRFASGGRVMDPRLAGKWICPMHPEIVADGPADCSVCGMALEPAAELGYATAVAGREPLVVPASAVLWTGTRSVVYVEQREAGGPIYEGREIVLGPRASQHYVVLAGLAEGERVVVNGAFKIDSELQIQAKASMMRLPGDPTGKAQVTAPFRQSLAPVYQHYFMMQEALASDDLDAAKRAAAGLTSALHSVQPAGLPLALHSRWQTELAHLTEALDAAAQATEIAGVRAAFEHVSHAVVQVEREIGHEGVRAHWEMFCPMAFDNRGATWLQQHDAIRNPYFGASMLKCGEVRHLHPGSGSGPEVPLVPKAGRAAPPPAPAGDAVAAATLEPVYAAYLAVQVALAGDRYEEARDACKGLAAAVASVSLGGPWPGQAAGLAAAARDGAAAVDIAGVRAAFRRASDAVLVLIADIGNAGPVARHQAFCPMAFDNTGATWLQEGEDIRNPWFGAAMLTCGNIQRTFPPRGEGGRK